MQFAFYINTYGIEMTHKLPTKHQHRENLRGQASKASELGNFFAFIRSKTLISFSV